MPHGQPPPVPRAPLLTNPTATLAQRLRPLIVECEAADGFGYKAAAVNLRVALQFLEAGEIRDLPEVKP